MFPLSRCYRSTSDIRCLQNAPLTAIFITPRSLSSKLRVCYCYYLSIARRAARFARVRAYARTPSENVGRRHGRTRAREDSRSSLSFIFLFVFRLEKNNTRAGSRARARALRDLFLNDTDTRTGSPFQFLYLSTCYRVWISACSPPLAPASLSLSLTLRRSTSD